MLWSALLVFSPPTLFCRFSFRQDSNGACNLTISNACASDGLAGQNQATFLVQSSLLIEAGPMPHFSCNRHFSVESGPMPHSPCNRHFSVDSGHAAFLVQSSFVLYCNLYIIALCGFVCLVWFGFICCLFSWLLSGNTAASSTKEQVITWFYVWCHVSQWQVISWTTFYTHAFGGRRMV